MKIHNLLNNPSDLPKVIENSRYKETEEQFILYRSLENIDGIWQFNIYMGSGFYSYDDNLWYVYHDEPLSRLSNVFTEDGGQKYESIESLEDEGCPTDLINQLTKVPIGFAYHEDITEDCNYVFVKEIVGWIEFPTYEEFMNIK